MRDTPKNVVSKIQLCIRVRCSAASWTQPKVRRISFPPPRQKLVFRLPSTASIWCPLALFVRLMVLVRNNIV
jgi:hypothetical protein